MGSGAVLCWILLALGRSTRLREDCELDQVVFGELGETIYLYPPQLPPGTLSVSRSFALPPPLQFGSKVILLKDVGFPIGLCVKDFTHDEEGLYTITTNGRVSKYTVKFMTRIEVDVGATLHIDPKFSVGTIDSVTWKYTPNQAGESKHLVNVLHHWRFGRRSSLDNTTGKLAVRDWRLIDDGVFTVDINNEEFVASFKVASIVRVKHDGDLNLVPNLGGRVFIEQFKWFHNKIAAVEYTTGDDVKYLFRPCLINTGNCNFDTATGALTIKSWQPSDDGVFSMMINGETYKNEIKVVGGILFAPIGEDLQLDPPSFDGSLNSITWFYDGNWAALFWQTDDVEYYQICSNTDNCNLNRTTGRLSIKTWDASYKYFTVEVNAVQKNNKYLVQGVKKLDEYDATSELMIVNDVKRILVCGGYFDGAEPVKYSWKWRDTDTWVEGTRIMESNVFTSFGRNVFVYDAYKITNPVSERVIVFE